MYDNSNIVCKNAKERIPDAFWDKALENTNVLGVAFADKAGFIKSIKIDDASKITKAGLNQIQDTFADNTVLFFLGQWETGFQKDSMQPFTIISDAKDKPILVGFLIGNYPTFMEEKSSHSAPFLACNKYITPKLQNLYKELKGDLPKVLDAIRSGTAQMDLQMSQIPGGAMVLFAANGEVMCITDKKTEFTKLSFGFVHERCGYTEDEQEIMKEEPAEEQSLADMLSSGETSATATEKKEENVVSLKKENEDEYDEIILKVPDNINSKNARKGWWDKNLGFRPANYGSLRQFTLRRNKATGEITDAEGITRKGKIAVNAFAEMAHTRNATSDTAPVKGSGKDVSAHHIPAPATAAADTGKTAEATVAATKPVITDKVSVLSNEDKVELKKQFLDGAKVKKAVDNHSLEIMDPEKFKTSLSKLKSFTEELSIKLTDTYVWDQEALEDLCKVNPTAASLLMMNYRATTPEFKAYVEQLSTPKKKEETVQTSVPQTQQRRRAGFKAAM